MGTFGKWNVQCAEAPASADGQPAGRSCGMTQQNKSEKNDKVAISVIVNKVKRGDKSALFMRIMTPIGVYLPAGIPVEIDGTALPSRLIYTRCVPPICEAMGEMSPDTLGKFKKGGASVFYLYDRRATATPSRSRWTASVPPRRSWTSTEPARIVFRKMKARAGRSGPFSLSMGVQQQDSPHALFRCHRRLVPRRGPPPHPGGAGQSR